MCYQVGFARDVPEFKKVWARLAGFMQLHACEVEWQTCFKACDECDMNPTTGKAAVCGILTQDGDPSVGTSGAASSGSQGPAKSGKAPVSVSRRSRLAEFFERPYDLGTVLKKRVVASATQPSASRAAPATGPSSTTYETGGGRRFGKYCHCGSVLGFENYQWSDWRISTTSSTVGPTRGRRGLVLVRSSLSMGGTTGLESSDDVS